MKPWKRWTYGTIGATSKRFNGATAMKPWKSVIKLGKHSINESLQWGHGDEAVEEAVDPDATLIAP